MRASSVLGFLLALGAHWAQGLKVSTPPADPTQLNLQTVFKQVSWHYLTWSMMCKDEVARSCGPTKALERVVLDRLTHEKGTLAAEGLARDLLGWVGMIVELERKHRTLAEAWKEAPKAANGEITTWASLGFDPSKVPANAFAFADSDKSGGLSQYEVIDFMHLCLELGGASKGLLSPDRFDPWSYGDWAGLNGGERQAAFAQTWRPSK
mmetsp:Transcript_130908/g.407088  ORF Transcript_130908/g.407088 Transcript_130908/m.407088 type:complete len:209 (+) Transcript_130908:69-695(+)